MTKVRGVLFDLDGTLRDTKTVIYSSVQYALKATVGREVSDEDLYEYMHHHMEVHKQFASEVTAEEFDAKFHENLIRFLPDVQLYEGTIELLEWVKSNDYKCGLVTSAISPEVKSFLEVMDVDNYFDTIVCADHVTNKKPHPEPVLRALDQLGLKSGEAIMVGDMRADILSAKAAGLQKIVMLTHGMERRESLVSAGAENICDNLTEVKSMLEKLTAEQLV